MHTSRMRTARSSSCHGGLGRVSTPPWSRHPPEQAPPEQTPLQQAPPGCGPGDPLGMGLETPPPQPDPSISLLGVGLETCKACWDTTPPPGDLLQGMLGYHSSPVDRMTDTSFAGGKNEDQRWLIGDIITGMLYGLTYSFNVENFLLRRLYLMSYFPSGFWPRLITRLLGDNTVYNLVLELYNLPDELKSNKHFMRTQGNCPEWKCWQVCLIEIM